ncbi:hypothetical protein C8J56DRAFT_853788 [Mycena floridula]|nr:hypothetical protein C8J56DRAFT_853788 [Mycena floridula]
MEMRQVVLQDLSWFRTICKVDEVQHIVEDALKEKWCKELDAELAYQTGRLSFLQNQLQSSTTTLLQASPCKSAVLSNSLEQIISNPRYNLSIDQLSKPLHSRRDQLLKYTTPRLHIAAQQLVLNISGSLAATSSAGFFAHFLGGLELGTAVPGAIFVFLFTTRWSIGRWERAKQAWWDDWERVGEALKRDLKTNLTKTLDEHVFVVPSRGLQGLQELVEKRRAQVELEEKVTTTSTPEKTKPSEVNS